MRIGQTKWLALICVALVAMIGVTQVTHVHANVKLPRHDCSVCSLVHASALAKGFFAPRPILTPSAIVATAEPSAVVFFFASGLTIRPPPIA